MLRAVRMPGAQRSASPPLLAQGWLQLLLGLSCVILLSTLIRLEVSWDSGGDSVAVSRPTAAPGMGTAPGPTLVSYSYFEKDDIQRANFEFFLAVGMVRARSCIGVPAVTAPSHVLNLADGRDSRT